MPSGDTLAVLLVGNNDDHARQVMLVLDEGGHRSVRHARTLGDGLSLLSNGFFDVALIDLLSDGSEEEDRVARINTAAPDLPIVVLSAADDEALAEEALAAGAEDFIAKDRLDADRLDRALRYAVHRKEAHRRLARGAIFQKVINRVLRKSLEDAPIEEILGQVLDEVTAVPFLSLQSKGCVFTADGETRTLRMRAHRNLTPAVIESCGLVPFGTCICGRAAEEGQTVFCHGLDDDHKVFSGRIQPHGHYCVPIVSDGGVLGILNIYVKPGHAENSEERWFLEAVGGTLATILKRKEAERILAERTEELKRSNADLEQFAYVASHDLQEPLRTIGSFLELLRKRSWDKLDEDSRAFLEFAGEGAERLQTLIHDLLEYSRITTRGHTFAPVDMERMAREVLTGLKVCIEEAEATVELGALPTVRGDESQLARLIQNLIGNALKYRTPERRPKISVTAEPGEGEWLFSVTDNGIGIKEEHRERIFLIFKRLHGRNHYSGTGIGLAVCKKIVERHGGRIWVDSAEPEGCVFRFTLPSEA